MIASDTIDAESIKSDFYWIHAFAGMTLGGHFVIQGLLTFIKVDTFARSSELTTKIA